MEFEQIRYIFSFLHYGVVWGSFLIILLWGFRKDSYNFGTLIKRFYIATVLWIGFTFLLNGCPITLIENKLAVYFWGKPFYPEYGFYDSDAFFILTYPKIYIPLFLYLTFIGVSRLSKNINNT